MTIIRKVWPLVRDQEIKYNRILILIPIFFILCLIFPRDNSDFFLFWLPTFSEKFKVLYKQTKTSLTNASGFNETGLLHFRNLISGAQPSSSSSANLQ